MSLIGEYLGIIDAARSTGGGVSQPGEVQVGPDFGGANGDRLAQGQALSLSQLEIITALAQGQALALSQLELGAALAQSHALALTQLDLGPRIQQGHRIGDPTLQFTGILAGEDTWVPEVALCPDDTNKDLTNLQVEGVVATRKDIYIQFNVASLAGTNNITLISAELTLYVITPNGLGTFGLSLDVDNTPRTFDEATLICSTAPAGGWTQDNSMTISIPATAGDVTFDLSSLLTEIQSVINSAAAGQLVFRIRDNSATLTPAIVFQSKDSGGSPGNASGPRLKLVFSVPA